MWRVRLVVSRECSERRDVADAVPLDRLRGWMKADLVLLLPRPAMPVERMGPSKLLGLWDLLMVGIAPIVMVGGRHHGRMQIPAQKPWAICWRGIERMLLSLRRKAIVPSLCLFSENVVLGRVAPMLPDFRRKIMLLRLCPFLERVFPSQLIPTLRGEMISLRLCLLLRNIRPSRLPTMLPNLLVMMTFLRLQPPRGIR